MLLCPRIIKPAKRGFIAPSPVSVNVGKSKREIGAVKDHMGGLKDFWGLEVLRRFTYTRSRGGLNGPWESQTKCFWVSHGLGEPEETLARPDRAGCLLRHLQDVRYLPKQLLEVLRLVRNSQRRFGGLYGPRQTSISLTDA